MPRHLIVLSELLNYLISQRSVYEVPIFTNWD